MKEVMLEAETRELTTNHSLKSLRAGGKIPAVFYGHNEKPMHLAVVARRLDEVVHGGGNVLVTLKIGDVTKTVIVKEVQRDVLTHKAIHIDFQAVSLKEKIEVSVPLHIVGVAPGVKLGGGILEHILRDIRVNCLPTDIPEAVNVDVSALQINQALTVNDLPKIDGIEYVAEPKQIVVNIVAPTIIEEKPAPGAEGAAAAAPGAAGAAEPEVISKGKKDKEEGAAPAAPAKGGEKK